MAQIPHDVNFTHKYVSSNCHEDRPTWISPEILAFPCGGTLIQTLQLPRGSQHPRLLQAPVSRMWSGLPRLDVLATTDYGPDAIISIFSLSEPDFPLVATLDDGSPLTYLDMAFSGDVHLVTLETLPEFGITLWDWRNQERLYQINSSEPPLTHPHLSTSPFSPWVCLTHKEGLDLFAVESCQHLVSLRSVSSFLLPLEDDPALESLMQLERVLTFWDQHFHIADHASHALSQLPLPASTGLPAPTELRKFCDRLYDRQRLAPVAHCWLPAGFLIICCAHSIVLKVHVPTGQLLTLRNPGIQTLSVTTLDSSASQELSSSPHDHPDLDDITCVDICQHGVLFGTASGLVQLVDISDDQWQPLTTVQLGCKVTMLSFGPNFQDAVIQSDKGDLLVYTPDPSTPDLRPKSILEVESAEIVGLGFLRPQCRYLVCARDTGVLELYRSSNFKKDHVLDLKERVSALSTSPTCHLVAVSSIMGGVYFVCLRDGKLCVVGFQWLLNSIPLPFIKFDNFGNFLVTSSIDGPVFVLTAAPASGFQVLGFVKVPGRLIAMDIFQGGVKDFSNLILLSSTKSCPITDAADIISLAVLPTNLPENLQEKVSPYGELLEKVIQDHLWDTNFPSFGLCISRESIYTFGVEDQAVRLHKYHIFTKKGPVANGRLQPHLSTKVMHDMLPSKMEASWRHFWLMTCGQDGNFFMRALYEPVERVFKLQGLDPMLGGVIHSVLNTEENLLVLAGKRGVFMAFTIQYVGSMSQQARTDWILNVEKQQLPDAVALAKLDVYTGNFYSDFTASQYQAASFHHMARRRETTAGTSQIKIAAWMDLARMKGLEKENDDFKHKRNRLKHQMSQIRAKVESMISINSSLFEELRLPIEDFAMAPPIFEELRGEEEVHLAKLKERHKAILENAEKKSQALKQRFWESMEVKGCNICAFKTNKEVPNYPLTFIKEEDRTELEKVLKKRRRDKLILQESEPGTPEIMLPPAASALESAALVPSAVPDEQVGVSWSGSLRALYGVTGSLLYSQEELSSREQMMDQVIMLKDVIHQLKLRFNDNFDRMRQRKLKDIDKIDAINVRVREILSIIQKSEEVWDPAINTSEEPSRVFQVSDDEVTVEKYLSPEELERLERLRREAAQKTVSKVQLMREKALMKMMGGVLEMRREDELRYEPEPPYFMLKKPRDHWNLEEQRKAEEFNKILKEFRDERDRFFRQLEAELLKLRANIRDAAQAFDQALEELGKEKILTDSIISQEETMILYLARSIAVEDELLRYEEFLHTEKSKIFAMLRNLATDMGSMEQDLSTYRQRREELLREERQMDYRFRQELRGHQAAETLLQLFRLRPTFYQSNLAPKDTLDPFLMDRPDQLTVESPLQELAALDNPAAHRPPRVEPDQWTFLCNSRRARWQVQIEVHRLEKLLSELEAALSWRKQEKTRLSAGVDKCQTEIHRLREIFETLQKDLMVQLVLRQGQVELPYPDFLPDYSDCVLVHRSSVDEPNLEIVGLGKEKITALTHSLRLKKNIDRLRWEHKRCMMELADLRQYNHDIRNSFVTRQMLKYMRGERDLTPDEELDSIRKDITQQDQIFSRDMQRCGHQENILEDEIQAKVRENEQLKKQVDAYNFKLAKLRLISLTES